MRRELFKGSCRIAVGLALLGAGSAVSAQCVYDNGDHNFVTGQEMTFAREADYFTLGGETKVTHVNFGVLDTNQGNNLGNWDGTGEWSIYADSAGAPGALIANGNGTNFTTNFRQNSGGWDWWDFGMDLDSAVCLKQGAYWLMLRLNRDCNFRADLYWATAATNGSPNSYFDINCSGSFAAGGLELAFCIVGEKGCSSDCISLSVDPLVAGQSADWFVSGATPGEQVAIVYGFSPGSTVVNGFGGYCASFGIQGVNQNRLICRKLADGAGNVTCTKKIPAGARGRRVLTQAAERNTCPNECVSNLDDQVVG